MEQKRESLASRIGFILLAAGCAIGLGNIWRFPSICGQGGGAIFLVLYLLCLAFLGFPIMVMELALGRGSQKSIAHAYQTLRPGKKNTCWNTIGILQLLGNFVLLMFYSVVTGWLMEYFCKYLSFNAFTPTAKITQVDFGAVFGSIVGSCGQQIIFTGIAMALTLLICIFGLQNSVERVTKFMMGGLLLLMIALAIQAAFLPGSGAGFHFFLNPDWHLLTDLKKLSEVFPLAMCQAFFTLSLGVGSIAICGSYTEKSHSLCNDSITIILLDTAVAVCAGLIIFPICFSYGIHPDAGPSLIFITLPKAFSNMPFGNLYGIVFFLFLVTAALTTLVAVQENIISHGIDLLHWNRKKSTLITCVLVYLLSFPCIFGFNIWSKFQPLGKGTCVLDLEDFIISDNLLPLGSLAIVLFCTYGFGWGIEKFLAETNSGKGIKLGRFWAPYLKYVLPLIVFFIWALGIYKRFLA